MINVYLGGKISKSDWRHDIFPKLYNYLKSDILSKEVSIIENGFCYSGPFFIDEVGGHIPAHGSGSHGQGGILYGDEYYDTHETRSRKIITKNCLEWINKSDQVFIWLDSLSAYGTMVEIGLAYQLKKKIFIAIPNSTGHIKIKTEMWFGLSLANAVYPCDSHLDGWSVFSEINNWGNMSEDNYIPGRSFDDHKYTLKQLHQAWGAGRNSFFQRR